MTQLAVAYAKRHLSDYSAMLWINARDETSLKQSFTRVGKHIANGQLSAAYLSKAVENGDPDQVIQAVIQ